MPIYEYECPKCGAFEKVQDIKAKPIKTCPKCRARVKKLISRGSFKLKGGGWAASGYQK